MEEKITNEELIKKNIKLNRIKVVTNIILLIVWMGIGAYLFLNIESFKSIGSDVCRLCMQETGKVCYDPLIK